MRLLSIGQGKDTLRGMTTILRNEGHYVDAADNADYGRSRWLNSDYDLIILDVTAAGCEALAADPQLLELNSDTPVLILTSRDGDSRKSNANAGHVLLKPFTRSELIERVRAMLRQPNASMDRSSIEIGSVVIDRIQQMVTVDRNHVALTSKEYCLLEFLARQRGTLVSRTDIYSHLFDITDPSLSNLLDVYVCKIRRKLGDRLITTRRGAGYVIES